MIRDRGTVVTGRLEGGPLSVGDVVTWTHPDGSQRSATVSGLEAFREKLTTAEPGRLIGVLLPGVERDDLSAGTVLVR